jgi:DNA-binding FadR family transcriptional regulator
MIDPSDDRSLYRQLADELRKKIESGVLAPGQKMPSELQMSQEQSVSRTTVRQAIQLLRLEGLVSVERPRGTFVRKPEPKETIVLAPGETAQSRMPADYERRDYRISEGVPVFVITDRDGKTTVHPADRVQLASS